MKPIQLTMQAFGSYGKKTVIDFTMPNQNLFLITGDTGAGKTTIFDALVFALYGQASSTSNKKDGVELQSQFADCALTPFVELIFSERSSGEERLYTVRRVPRHLRPLKKGKGIKEDKETVSLILPDGREYSQNRQETNTKLEEIIGLTQGQFMQVAMIAQGEFMELLRADSNKKKDIFRKLFNTEIYQQIVSELDRRCKEKLAQMAQIRTVCQTETAHIVIPRDSEYGESLKILKDRILSSDRLNEADMDQLLEVLQGVCQELEADLKVSQAVCAEASTLRDQARDAYQQGKALAGAFERLDNANRSLAECEDAQPLMDQKNRLIAEIRGAYEIAAVHQRYLDAKMASADTAAQLERQEGMLPGLDEASSAAAAEEESARTEKDAQLTAFTAVSERVTAALEVLKKHGAAAEDVFQKEKYLAQAEQQVQEAKERLEAFEQEAQIKRLQMERLSDAKLRMSKWETSAKEAEDLDLECQALEVLQKELDTQRETAKRAKENYAVCRQEWLDKNEEYSQKRNAFLDAQAGYLAKEKLHPGKPCPVCGSLDHPAPRILSEEHRELTREIIDGLAREVEAIQSRQESASSTASSAVDVLSEKEANYLQAEQKLRDRIVKSLPASDSQGTPEQMHRAVLERKAQLSSEEPQLRMEVEAFEAVYAFIGRTEETGRTLREAAEHAGLNRAKAQSELAVSVATRDSLGRQMDYPSEAEAIAARTAAQTRKQTAESTYKLAHQRAVCANSAKEKAQTLIRQFSESLPIQKGEQEQRKAAYQEILKKGQMEESRWQIVIATHSKTEIEALQDEIQRHFEKKAAATGARDTALETVADMPRPDLVQLVERVNAAEQALQDAKACMEQIREVSKADRGAFDALAPKMEACSRISREFSKIDCLRRRLAGKETGSRMDIETFVQRYYLQRILYAANTRFRDMSGGQFELRMTSEDQAGAGKNRGLDLMVYSTVTGREREVRTLSGGESFMAALSLALGMADQIQESTAAVNLDVMFIDEGFGSLDSRSREQAVKVLQQMASGSKLIGIISHVTELKQAIEDQLVVCKDETGSHPRWIIS